MKNDTKVLIGLGAVIVLGFGTKEVIDLKNASENEKKYAPVIAATEKKYGIPSGVLHKLIKTESAFRTDVITGKKRSGVGALGIAQFMPATAREVLGSEDAALDPIKAIDGAGKYLQLQYVWTGRKSWTEAVAAYNWGAGNVNKKGLANAPRETRNYVASILGVTV